ncbi:hypothetical protein CQA53_09460 [Helicobacter didelphidarum]|uniref:Dynamin N-terminal domain-containing protein n=1 Tax=Helicobacter didelphidarum TaxID=2040648 RepID=A0A3D8IAR1_9HELI|nr:dynamin family protein [Helicobacter didelphidarum]RDU62232.1 hypothetical protein CQA53_09460 [Helicobacter didelphidarum]
MDIATLFFENLYHEHIPEEELCLDTQFLDSATLELKAIILSLNFNNIAIYSKSPIFQQIYTKSFLQNFQDNQILLDKESQNIMFEYFKIIQYYILKHITPNELKSLKPYIVRLNAADLIDNKYARDLLAFFTQSALSMVKDSQEKHAVINLKSLSEELESIYKKLYELKFNEEFYKKLDNILKNAKTNKFSIGITGVLSAGKSTFLNALLGKEVLGSSTIPETANLTLLKYNQTEYARVHFWNQSEWEELKKSGLYDKSLQEFVEESNKIFGENLSSYITKDGKSQEIKIDELSTFTSANDESKLCNLVKEVELFTDLKFLQNGVEIVDTPGLDDPITKREEITKTYIEYCDLLIHVMNASCVATQIDIDFILECLLQQNISRLLIVLTRIDLIGEKELQQSLEYTKQSLAAQLKKAQYSGDIDALIERIDFIPTASFMALMLRTNREKEALEKGFDLKKTGILAVEEYLDKMLLGENSLKQKDILYIAYRAFLRLAKESQDELALEAKILSASKEELEVTLQKLKDEHTNLHSSLDSKQHELDLQLKELEDFLYSLHNFVNKSLKTEQNKLKERIYNDAIYSYQNGIEIDKKRICEVLTQGFEDCFNDVSRDYKYKLSKKITQILHDTTENQAQLEQPHIRIATPKDEIAKSLKILIDTIPNLVVSHSKNSQNDLSVKLDFQFSESFKLFSEVIAERNKEIQEKFLKYFAQISQLQKEEIQAQITKQETILQNTLSQREKANSPELQANLATKQQELEAIIGELEYIEHTLK